MARSMILHASMHWKDGIDASIWPQAVTYAAHVYNNTPKDGVCLADVFTGSTVHRQSMMGIWGCPICVLDPKSNKGNKYQDRNHDRDEESSWDSVSNIPVRFPWCSSLATGAITNQWYVMFDDLFTTVPSIERETEPPKHWADLRLENSTHIMVDSPVEHVGDDWLTEEELEPSVVVKIDMRGLEDYIGHRAKVCRAII
jgi:hypothetical protein